MDAISIYPGWKISFFFLASRDLQVSPWNVRRLLEVAFVFSNYTGVGSGGGGERNNFLGARFARRIRAFQKALFKVGSSDMNVDMTVSGHPDPVNSNDKAR